MNKILLLLMLFCFNVVGKEPDVKLLDVEHGELFKVTKKDGKELWCYSYDSLGSRIIVYCFAGNFQDSIKENKK